MKVRLFSVPTFWLALMLLLMIQGAVYADDTLTLLFTNDTHNRLEPYDHVELKKRVGGIRPRALRPVFLAECIFVL